MKTISLIANRGFYRLIGLLAFAGLAILPGCATYSAGFAGVENATANRDLDGAVKALEKLNLTGPDQTLHDLNKATLLRLKGNYAESNQHFEIAKNTMERLSAVSISEQAASATINDTLKAYEGLPSEQLMVYAFKALNYLQMGDASAAAVEARQFDVKQRLIAEKNKNAKYLSGAFVRYLNSMVYEAAGEGDSARIEMEKAIEGYKRIGSAVPLSLARDAERANARTLAPSEVVLILHNGLGASVVENNIRVRNPDPVSNKNLAVFSLAVPKFVKRSLPVARVVLSSGPATATSEVVEDVNGIAEMSFNDGMPAIIARGVARLVIKNAAAAKVKKEAGNNELLKLFADVGAIVSERADTRTWSLLPGNIQMARLPLATGRYDLTATYYSANGGVVGTREFKGVEVRDNQKAFLSDYVMYPPAAR
jgi:uncharacterized protein